MRTLPTLFAVAVAIRWSYSAIMFLALGTDGLLGVDSGDYVDRGRFFAEDFAAGALQGWHWLGPKPIMMPLFTWLIAANALLFGPYAAFTYVLTQGLFDAGTCLLVFGTARSIDKRYALPAGVASAANPTQIVMSGLVYPDTVFVFFVALLLFGATRWLRQPSWPNALIIALALAGSAWMRILVTPFAVALVVFLLAASAVAGRFKIGQAVQLCAVVAIFAISLAPISMRNQSLYGSWSLTPQGGMHLARWVVPLVWEVRDGTPWARGYEVMERRAHEQPGADEGNPFRQSQRYTEVAVEELNRVGIMAIVKAWTFGAAINLGAPGIILSPPVIKLPRTGFYAVSAASVVEKIGNFLFRSDNVTYAWILLAGITGVAIFRLLQLAGFASMLANGHVAAALLLAGWCLFILCVNGPVASPKYRLPMEPALAVLTGAGLVAFWKRKAPAGRTA